MNVQEPGRRILATDLDGTLVGHPEALARLKTVIERYREDWLLVYATGRTMFQGRRLQQEEQLPEPDVWVTEVGAAITYAEHGPDETWQARMAEGWDREVVERLAYAHPAMTPQPEEAMGPFKVSFRIAPEHATHVLPRLERQLAEAGTPALLIYSSQRDLDIVPATAGKAAAIRHLSRRYDVPLSQILTCGDSANDRDMLCLGGPAVAVANAHEELIGLPLPETVLHAQGQCADGILEALHHYSWISHHGK